MTDQLDAIPGTKSRRDDYTKVMGGNQLGEVGCWEGVDAANGLKVMLLVASFEVSGNKCQSNCRWLGV